jgi:hypothetical protein
MSAATVWILVAVVALGAVGPAQGAETRGPASTKRPAPPKTEAAVPGPGEQLRGHLDRVVAALRQAPAPAGAPRENPGHAALVAMFDLPETARRIVDRSVGSEVTTAQRRELGTALTDVMSRVMRRIADHLRLAHDTSLERYASRHLAFRETFNDGREAVVESALPGKGDREIPLTAWMVRRGPRWLVSDIRVNDDGLVDSYQAQCAAILRRSSYATLLQRLRDKREFLDVAYPLTAALVRPSGGTPTALPVGPSRLPASPAMSP